MRAMAIVSMMVVLGAVPPPEPARQAMAKIVARIQKADYEDDRKALRSLAADLAPYTEQRPLVSRALYWRGFAMWRRAMNGFNDSTDPKELQSDLTEAVRAFTDATAKDPELADAKAAASACLYSLAYLNKDDVERRKAYIKQGVKLLDEAKLAAPENPRVLWVQGGGEWWVPAELGGGHAKAFETYTRGLEFARREKGRVNDPLEPSGGEPELLMSIAWSRLNSSTPDVAAAESNARAALALVPNWHYVRDILLPQIRAKATEAPPVADPARKEASPTDFDFLEGKWAIVYNNAQPGIPPDLRGTWTASKQADGRVLYDEFRILGPKGETFSLGASYRVFDHVRKQWDCRYVQLILPGGDGVQKLAQWAEFTAWPEGEGSPTLRVDQKGSRGSLRITYFDIAKDHFRWKADLSIDGGKTWFADQIRIEATRAADSERRTR
jgi:hypothetical protein